MGLTISKQLVALIEGQIGVYSQPGKGSTFWFTAKLEKQKQPVVSHQNYSKLRDLRVLVVDDNATSRCILHRQLLFWKMLPACAASGKEGLKMMRDAASAGKPYGLVLLDFGMLEMDGLAASRYIQSDPAINGTPIVMLISHRQLFTPRERQEFGIDSFLFKPVKNSRLFDCLWDSMHRSTAQTGTHLTATSASAATPPRDTAAPKKVRILLADDNIINQKVGSGQLHKLGYTAQAVANGLEVIKALEQVPYDVVMMDCQMPELDGYETTRAIREREKSPNQRSILKSPVYIIAMTANALQGEREKCLGVGMDDYLSKPVRTADLQTVLERSACARSGSIASDVLKGYCKS